MSDPDPRAARATVDAVLAREGIDVDKEVRDRLARQLPAMDAFRMRLRTWPLPTAPEPGSETEP